MDLMGTFLFTAGLTLLLLRPDLWSHGRPGESPLFLGGLIGGLLLLAVLPSLSRAG